MNSKIDQADRALNFSAGPAVLPASVLLEAQEHLLSYRGSGMSIMEQSHRGKDYGAVHEEALSNVRKLLGLSDEYAVLFLQGGATAQFAMVPMNLLGPGQTADYVNSGAWAAKAIKEAKVVGNVHIAADTSQELPARVPDADHLELTEGSAYLHITSNETISGAQWKAFPRSKAPLVADMSSDIFSRPLDIGQFGLIYAGAQKNLGPSGITLVVIRKDLIERVSESVPLFFRYKTHFDANSLYNTPPTFSMYLVCLVTRWLRQEGGLAAIHKRNEEKADKLYGVIDGTEFYRGTADIHHRSAMNVTFRLPAEGLEKAFLEAAGEQDLKGLKGHRSVGGIRASIYNAFPAEGVDVLADFMREFEKEAG
jgi:phosphoserine aminotransferase